ncbi:MAG: 3-phenylpropionate/cinnamic acid dioxygenase subunit beta [Dehalococcoidia bacterium]
MTTAASKADTQALWFDIQQFYIDEAWLLDERKYKEWLALLTDDIFYYAPRRKNVYRREIEREIPPRGTDLAYFEEDHDAMEVRVARLETGMAWSDDPPSRTRHIVGNLKVERRDNGDVWARSAFLVYRSHLEVDQDIYSGSREDILRPNGDSWKIAERTILLDANVLLSKNISIFF